MAFANTLQNSLNTVIGGVNSALRGIPGSGDRATIPTITINTSLSNVSPPDSWSGPLNELNKKLPTLDDLRAALANLIDKPFDALSGQINSTFSEVASSFNAAQLPLPAVRTVQFCNNVDTSIVYDIGRPLIRIAETTALIPARAGHCIRDRQCTRRVVSIPTGSENYRGRTRTVDRSLCSSRGFDYTIPRAGRVYPVERLSMVITSVDLVVPTLCRASHKYTKFKKLQVRHTAQFHCHSRLLLLKLDDVKTQ